MVVWLVGWVYDHDRMESPGNRLTFTICGYLWLKALHHHVSEIENEIEQVPFCVGLMTIFGTRVDWYNDWQRFDNW